MIVDTSVWVEVERQNISEAALTSLLGGQSVYITPITVAELMHGAVRADSAERRAKRTGEVNRIRMKPCLLIDGGTGGVMGDLVARLEMGGRATSHRIHDLWIASLAIQHGHKILTLNVRDFEDIPGIKVLTLP